MGLALKIIKGVGTLFFFEEGWLPVFFCSPSCQEKRLENLPTRLLFEPASSSEPFKRVVLYNSSDCVSLCQTGSNKIT